jgi:hypothetical protein
MRCMRGAKRAELFIQIIVQFLSAEERREAA